MQSLRIKSAIPHPRIMGVIRECGGKMHMTEGWSRLLASSPTRPVPSTTPFSLLLHGRVWRPTEQWDKAHQDFFEAFKNYDEAGSPRRIQCLKYLVLANMLMESEIDPFTAPETKPYKSDPEILAMTNLVSAYQRNEILEFEHILRGPSLPLPWAFSHRGSAHTPHGNTDPNNRQPENHYGRCVCAQLH